MKPSRSIRARLSRSYFVFFILVVLLGGVAVSMISLQNSVSSEIRDRWLQNTRFIGDFENFTSDYRAAEGAMLLSSPAEAVGTKKDEMARLDRFVLATQLHFEHLPHDKTEAEFYRHFQDQWHTYKAVADKVFALFQAGKTASAIELFKTDSKAAYTDVSYTLEKLRRYNHEEVEIASRKSEQTNYDVLWLVALAVVVTDGLAFVASLYVRRSVFNPLIDLIAAMRALAQNRTDIDVVGAERTDEIGEVARAVLLFKGNIISLADSQQSLEQQAVVLKQSLESEKRLTTHQRNFVSMVSHEFRTPLNVIDGQAQRLRRHRDEIQAPEIESRTKSIRAAVLRMTNLIDTLLDATRLIDGDTQLVLHPVQFDLTALLRDVCHQHREISPHAEIRENFTDAPLPIFGDFRLLSQSFSNVIGNSVKYSNRNALIDISTRSGDGTVAVIIADNGIGVPMEDLPNLFDRYYRGSNVSGIVGTGIGLYLVKTVIEHHGGTLSVKSTVGVGTEITVTLPTAPPGKALTTEVTFNPAAIEAAAKQP